MKKLKVYTGVLKDYSVEDQEQIIKTFINLLVLDLNAKLTVGEINHIGERMKEHMNRSISIKTLRDIHFEIISNYKKYTPLCYSSIVSANKTMQANKK